MTESGTTHVISSGFKTSFEEVLNKHEDKTSVWHYFLVDKRNGLGKCKSCEKHIKATGGSTKGIRDHLKKIHKIDLSDLGKEIQVPGSDAETAPPKPKQQKLTTFFRQKDDVSTVLSRLSARDGLSFKVIAASVDVRKGLISRGFTNVPVSHNGVKNVVMKFSNQIRCEQREEILNKSKAGIRFSITFDEWTSLRNRRYLNVYLHESPQSFWNLGLVRMHGHSPATACLAAVEGRIENYGLRLSENIVAISTDGTSTMKKIGRLTPTHQQLCFAHGMQLAVLDVLYRKSVDGPVVEETESALIASEPSNIKVVSDEDDDDEWSENESNQEAFCMITADPLNDTAILSHGLIGPIIDKVRKAVKLFKKSAAKNDAVLQKHVISDFGKEMKVILDCKTRWNSLYNMVERFNLLKKCILKSLIDIKSDIKFSEEELISLSEVKEALEPMKAAVEALCRRDINLFSADAVLEFALNKLLSMTSDIAIELAAAVEIRIGERRTLLSGVLKYLHSGKKGHSREEGNLFSIPAKTIIQNTLFGMLDRLHVNDGNNEVLEPELSEQVEELERTYSTTSAKLVTAKSKTLLETELDTAISSAWKSASTAKPQNSKSLADILKKEMMLFEATGNRGHFLQKAYSDLMSVPPTSVESERAFSCAGYFCSKIRSSLNDDTLDSLCFLRDYFKKEDFNK